MTNQEVLREATVVIRLLDAGKIEEAWDKINVLDEKMSTNEKGLEADVAALWIQAGIAASNMEDAAYFEHVKDELNRVTFKYYGSTR